MRVLSLQAFKGGVGKTTLSSALATAAWKDGLRVVAIDLDPQGSLAAWADRRGDDPPDVISTQAVRLPKLVEKLTGEVDLLILDTPPNAADPAGLAAIQIATYVLVPSRVAMADLEATIPTFKLAQQYGKPSAVVFNDEDGRRRARVVEQATEVLTQQGIEVVPTVIHSRTAISESQDVGRTILETQPASPGSDEIRALWSWVRQSMGNL